MRGKEEQRTQTEKKANSIAAQASTSTPTSSNIPTSRFYYLRGALGDGRLLEEHKHTVRRLVTGNYADSDLEQLRGIKNVWSFRLSQKARLLFTFEKFDGADYLVLLDYLPTHDYHKSRFLQRGVLKRYLARQKDVFEELIEEESEDNELDESLFESSSSAELRTRLGQFSRTTDFDAVALEYYQERMIKLNVEQEEACNVQLPAVISGGAGSGKSCVAFSLLSSYLLSHVQTAGEEREEQEEEQRQVPLKLLYVSQSPFLVRKMQENWQHLPQALHQAQVDFKTYQQLLDEGKEGQQAADFSTFAAWYTPYRSQLKKAARVKGTKIPDVDAQQAYQECRIRSGYSAEDYLKLGTKQSELSKEEHGWINEVYQAYQRFLQDANRYAPEFSALGEQNRYDLVVVDEAQDLSHLQLLSLHEFAKNRAVAYCMDSHQRLFDVRSVRPYILQKLHIPDSSHIELNTMYRCPPKIRAVTNEVIAFKHRLAAGTADSYESTQIEKGVYTDDSLGHVYVLNREMLAQCSWMKEQALGTNFAVVTPAAHREEATRYFNTPLIFTPEEIKGLEYDFVATFRLYPQALFREAQQRMKKLPVDKQPTHQPKAGNRDDHFTPDLNRIYTSYARAKKGLIICEDFNPANDLLLTRLRPIADKGLPTQEGLQQSNYVDWQQEATAQKAAGNVAVAKAIEARLNFFQPVKQASALAPVQVLEQRKANQDRKGKGKEVSGKKTSATTGQSTPAKMVRQVEVPANLSQEEKTAVALFTDFNETRLTLSLRLLDSTALLFKEYRVGKTPFVLFEKLIKDKQLEILSRCAVNDLDILAKLPCKQMRDYLKKSKTTPHAYNLVEKLFSLQQTINRAKKTHSISDNEKHTPASIIAGWGKAGDLHSLHELGADLNKPNGLGETPVYIAARRGQLNALLTLKRLNADFEKPTIDGVTPAHAAAIGGHCKVFLLLKELGVRMDRPTKDGLTPAHFASMNGNLSVLMLFHQWGINLETPAKDGSTPAFMAATQGHDSLLSVFKEWNVNLDTQTNDGKTLAHIAARKGYINILLLLHRWGINLEIPANDGTTPAFAAAHHGQDDVLVLLHALGIKVDTPAKNGITAPYMAARYGHVNILNLFNQWGVKLDIPTSQGGTAVHMAASYGQVEVLELFHQWGVKLDIPAKDGATPAHFAAAKGCIKVLKLFQKLGVKLDIKSNNGATPVHAATEEGHSHVLSLLHNFGVKLDTPAADGWTPVFTAANKGNIDALKLFHGWGIRLDTVLEDGLTPIFIAAQKGHIDVIHYLIEINSDVNSPFISSVEGLKIFAEKNKVEPMKMEDLIFERLQKGDSESALKIFPIDVARLMGHNNIVEALNKHLQASQKYQSEPSSKEIDEDESPLWLMNRSVSPFFTPLGEELEEQSTSGTVYTRGV